MSLGKSSIDSISQIDGNGSVEEIHGRVTEAVTEFIQHEKGRA